MENQNIKASIRQLHLLQLLERAQIAVGRQTPYFLLEIYLTRIVCTATDGQMTIIAEKVKHEDDTIDFGGTVCVPAKDFMALISALPDTHIELTGLTNQSLLVTCGDYSGVVPGVDHQAHFPTVPQIDTENEIYLDGYHLSAMYTASAHAVGDGKNPVLGGLCLAPSSTGICCVATNGHCMSVSSRDISIEGQPLPELDKAIVIPAKAFSALVKLNGTCKVDITDTVIAIESSNTTLIIQLHTGAYPEFRRVIPTGHPGCIVVNAKDLAETVERVNILSESDGVVLDILSGEDGGDIKIETANKSGEISDLVAAEVQGAAIKIKVTPKYLLEALRSLAKTSEDVLIKYNGGGDSLVLMPCDHSGWNERIEIIMPRKL